MKSTSKIDKSINNPTREIFKPIKNYEGLYEISNLGTVKSLSRWIENNLCGNYLSKEKTLKYSVPKGGYPTVTLSKNGCVKAFSIHRLVAIHFIENPKNKRIVNHINGDKSDFNVDNLEWSTYSENIIHALSTGLNTNGTKLSRKQVIEIYENKEGLTGDMLSEKYNVSASIISLIKNNKSRKHIINNHIKTDLI